MSNSKPTLQNKYPFLYSYSRDQSALNTVSRLVRSYLPVENQKLMLELLDTLQDNMEKVALEQFIMITASEQSRIDEFIKKRNESLNRTVKSVVTVKYEPKS